MYLNVFPYTLIIYKASKNVFYHLFEYIFYHLFGSIIFWRDSIQSIKEGVSTFIWMYLFLPWYYAEYQRKCSIIYLNQFSSAVILRRPPNKAIHNIFAGVILWHDTRRAPKNVFYHLLDYILCITPNKMLHYFKCALEIIYNPSHKTI